jgi:hypothetical protein
VARPRLASLQRAAEDVVQAMRRRERSRRQKAEPPARPPVPAPTADELARRLDETRARLRRDIPPPGDEH